MMVCGAVKSPFTEPSFLDLDPALPMDIALHASVLDHLARNDIGCQLCLNSDISFCHQSERVPLRLLVSEPASVWFSLLGLLRGRCIKRCPPLLHVLALSFQPLRFSDALANCRQTGKQGK